MKEYRFAPPAPPNLLEILKHEIALLRRNKHPNIVRYLGTGASPSRRCRCPTRAVMLSCCSLLPRRAVALCARRGRCPCNASSVLSILCWCPSRDCLPAARWSAALSPVVHTAACCGHRACVPWPRELLRCELLTAVCGCAAL
jgi:hypothetical protein